MGLVESFEPVKARDGDGLGRFGSVQLPSHVTLGPRCCNQHSRHRKVLSHDLKNRFLGWTVAPLHFFVGCGSMFATLTRKRMGSSQLRGWTAEFVLEKNDKS